MAPAAPKQLHCKLHFSISHSLKLVGVWGGCGGGVVVVRREARIGTTLEPLPPANSKKH